MKGALLKIFLCMTLAACGLCGCSDKPKVIKNSAQLLAAQNQKWNECLEFCAKGQPNLDKLYDLGGFLGSRTRVTMEKEYAKPNKEQAIALLKEIGEEYQTNVISLTEATEQGKVLKPGVTNEDVCKAFKAMNEKYQKLVEMTK